MYLYWHINFLGALIFLHMDLGTCGSNDTNTTTSYLVSQHSPSWFVAQTPFQNASLSALEEQYTTLLVINASSYLSSVSVLPTSRGTNIASIKAMTTNTTRLITSDINKPTPSKSTKAITLTTSFHEPVSSSKTISSSRILIYISSQTSFLYPSTAIFSTSRVTATTSSGVSKNNSEKNTGNSLFSSGSNIYLTVKPSLISSATIFPTSTIATSKLVKSSSNIQILENSTATSGLPPVIKSVNATTLHVKSNERFSSTVTIYLTSHARIFPTTTYASKLAETSSTVQMFENSTVPGGLSTAIKPSNSTVAIKSNKTFSSTVTPYSKLSARISPTATYSAELAETSSSAIISAATIGFAHTAGSSDTVTAGFNSAITHHTSVIALSVGSILPSKEYRISSSNFVPATMSYAALATVTRNHTISFKNTSLQQLVSESFTKTDMNTTSTPILLTLNLNTLSSSNGTKSTIILKSSMSELTYRSSFRGTLLSPTSTEISPSFVSSRVIIASSSAIIVDTNGGPENDKRDTIIYAAAGGGGGLVVIIIVIVCIVLSCKRKKRQNDAQSTKEENGNNSTIDWGEKWSTIRSNDIFAKKTILQIGLYGDANDGFTVDRDEQMKQSFVLDVLGKKNSENKNENSENSVAMPRCRTFSGTGNRTHGSNQSLIDVVKEKRKSRDFESDDIIEEFNEGNEWPEVPLQLHRDSKNEQVPKEHMKEKESSKTRITDSADTDEPNFLTFGENSVLSRKTSTSLLIEDCQPKLSSFSNDDMSSSISECTASSDTLLFYAGKDSGRGTDEEEINNVSDSAPTNNDSTNATKTIEDEQKRLSEYHC